MSDLIPNGNAPDRSAPRAHRGCDGPQTWSYCCHRDDPSPIYMTTVAQSMPLSPEAPARGPVLRVRDLAVSFDNGSGPRVRAVDGVCLSIYGGQTLAVVGESGCGKSVTAMSTLQLVPRPPGSIDRGRIMFRPRFAGSGIAPEIDLLGLSERQMRSIRGNEIAMIFQEPMTSLNPVYTVGDQILEAILLHQQVSRPDALGDRDAGDAGCGHPRARASDQAVPAPVLRRHAPARDDRHGAGLPAATAAGR